MHFITGARHKNLYTLWRLVLKGLVLKGKNVQYWKSFSFSSQTALMTLW